MLSVHLTKTPDEYLIKIMRHISSFILEHLTKAHAVCLNFGRSRVLKSGCTRTTPLTERTKMESSSMYIPYPNAASSKHRYQCKMFEEKQCPTVTGICGPPPNPRSVHRQAYPKHTYHPVHQISFCQKLSEMYIYSKI